MWMDILANLRYKPKVLSSELPPGGRFKIWSSVLLSPFVPTHQMSFNSDPLPQAYLFF